MSQTVVLVGAGGKMGMRIARNLVKSDEYRTLYCETAEEGVARLAGIGASVTPAEDALPEADTAIFSVPDRLIGEITGEMVPRLRSGATVLMLDPAAPLAGEVAVRDGIDYVVCHPCHPPLFGEQPSDEARRDYFGGAGGWMDVVIAPMEGSEKALEASERLCRVMYAPLRHVHRITVEQMAILEPAMTEVVIGTAAKLMKEAVEEAVNAGVPRPAVESFAMGHIQIPLAIFFEVVKSPMSDAAKIAIRWGEERIVRPDWRKLYAPDQVRAVIREMLHPDQAGESAGSTS